MLFLLCGKVISYYTMPYKDGTGPQGKGPRTGRGIGPCMSDNRDVDQKAGRLLGIGRRRSSQGRGRGDGRGQGIGRNA